MKLLIAEDDLTSRTMLAAVTSKWGYEPVEVEDGEAAWQIMQGEDAPRLLLLDWEMPKLDGLALCQRIRQQKDKDSNPTFIILLTARNETAYIVEGLNAGANDYITKPFKNAELQARLQVGRRMLDLQEELNSAKQALAIQANHDELTGLINRRALMEAMEQEMARANRQSLPLHVGLVDIDHFKQVNDSHGHLAGDAILRDVASRLGTTLRTYDRVGRYGGEEFMILLSCDAAHAQEAFERIRRAIADEAFVYEEVTLQITISCGVTSYTPLQDTRNSTELLAAADDALYEAKAAGRNRTVFAQAI